MCREADKREGELIRAKALAEAAELAAREAERRREMLVMNEDTEQANATLQAFRAKERERERAVELAIEGGWGMGS